jgi:hypothetical protein
MDPGILRLIFAGGDLMTQRPPRSALGALAGAVLDKLAGAGLGVVGRDRRRRSDCSQGISSPNLSRPLGAVGALGLGNGGL